MKSAPKKYGKELSAKTLSDLRKEKGLSQEEVAKHLHLSRSTIVKMETARQDIRVEYLFEFAQFFGTTADYILGLTNVRRAPKTLPACDELGLSDMATVKLEELGERRSRILSKLVEHDLFETLLQFAENAIFTPEPSPRDESVDMKELTALAKSAGCDLIPSRTKRSYDLYMASMVLQAIIEDVSDNAFPYSTDIDLENGG